MKEPRDLRELVGDDVAADELERLSHADRLLRSVPPPPPEVPQSLTQAVARVPPVPRPPRRRRRSLALSLAFVAALAALAFGLGRWTASDEFQPAWTVTLAATEEGAGATGLIEVGERDENGNMPLLVDVSGLPTLEPGESYALWLERDGEWAATCGYFAVGDGQTTVQMSVSYEIDEFDAWVISRSGRSDEPPPLLAAEIGAT